MPPDWDKVRNTNGKETQMLKERVKQLESTIAVLEAKLAEKDDLVKNKDGLPVGSKIQADVEGVGTVWLTVLPTSYQFSQLDEKAIYQGKKFRSLSAAAEFFSRIKRKSGWVYWRTDKGKTLKDAYKG